MIIFNEGQNKIAIDPQDVYSVRQASKSVVVITLRNGKKVISAESLEKIVFKLSGEKPQFEKAHYFFN